MPFTVNLSGTTQYDDSIVQAYDAAFIVANGQADVATSLAQYNASIGAKSIEFPRYARLALATTPLDEVEDVVSEAISDSKVIFTPEEYGKAVTRTALANLQTGGRADLAAARLVGLNMGETMNKLATMALEGSTNVRIAAGKTEATVAAGDVLNRTELNFVYNKLARSNVPAHSGGMYILLAHDDVIADLRADTSTGSWVDVNKYADPATVLANEVGMFQGFRVIRNNHATVVDQSGAGTVDVYDTIALGFNGLGMAVSKPGSLVISGPFDKLGRFVNMGWHGVMKFGIVEPDAVWRIRTASSLGANA